MIKFAFSSQKRERKKEKDFSYVTRKRKASGVLFLCPREAPKEMLIHLLIISTAFTAFSFARNPLHFFIIQSDFVRLNHHFLRFLY